MTPVASLDGLVDRDLVTGLHCLRDHHRQFIDDKGWVCLSRRNEILLDAEMDLQISTFEPTAIPRGELWRLHLFIEAEDAMIERPSPRSGSPCRPRYSRADEIIE